VQADIERGCVEELLAEGRNATGTGLPVLPFEQSGNLHFMFDLLKVMRIHL
jgi:hypothetical protein